MSVSVSLGFSVSHHFPAKFAVGGIVHSRISSWMYIHAEPVAYGVLSPLDAL